MNLYKRKNGPKFHSSTGQNEGKNQSETKIEKHQSTLFCVSSIRQPQIFAPKVMATQMKDKQSSGPMQSAGRVIKVARARVGIHTAVPDPHFVKKIVKNVVKGLEKCKYLCRKHVRRFARHASRC
jgi:hypothetical protein